MFEGASTIADIPAAVVRKRLPHALELADLRERTVYQESDPEALAAVKRSFVDFGVYVVSCGTGAGFGGLRGR